MKTIARKHCLLLGISIIVQLSSRAQGQDNAQGQDKSWHLTAGVNPAALLDPLYPTGQPFLRIKKSRFSLTYTHGFLCNIIFRSHMPDSADFTVEKNKWALGYTVHNKWGSLFCQLEFLQGYYRQKLWKDSYNVVGRDQIDFDYAYNSRRVWAISISNGLVANLSRRIDLEFSEALGVRVIDNRYDDVINPVPFTRNIESLDTRIQNTKAGKRVTPHLMISTSLCYRIF